MFFNAFLIMAKDKSAEMVLEFGRTIVFSIFRII